MSENSTTRTAPSGAGETRSAGESGAPAPPPRSPLAIKLEEARVELRRDLEVSRHVFRGEVSYVLQDPLTFQNHRFSTRDYAILLALHIDRTLGETFEELVGEGRLGAGDEERFYHFILAMHRGGFLKLPISDEETLYRRHVTKQAQKRKGLATSLLFLQVPLWNPDQFLTRTVRFLAPFLGMRAFLVWCGLVGLALWALVQNWHDFQRPVADIFSGGNLPLLWATLIVLKIAHEFGHAYVCKRFGGYVPEMGVYMILFTPCAFVDASSSWSFSRKQDRLLVCLGGIYVEVAIAAAALLLWTVTPPGIARQCLHNVVLLGSVVTIGFNINPLMRYDGYYALSDLVEIPNLRARAQGYAVALLKRAFLGVPIASPARTRTLAVWLVSFGIASALYKVVLVIGISMAIATKFPIGGLLLGGLYFGGEFVRVVRRTLPHLWSSAETGSRRVRARLYGLLLVVGLPAFVAGVPLPARVAAPGVIVGGDRSVLRAEAAGFLRAVHVEPGERVAPAALLYELEEPDKSANHKVTHARLSAARVRQRLFESEDLGDARKETARVTQLESELDYMRADLERLAVRADRAGTVIDAPESNELGRFVKRGEPLATVARGRPIVRALLTQEDVAAARPEIGAEVEFLAADGPRRPMRGTVRRIRPTGTRQLADDFQSHLDLSDFSLNPLTQESARSQFELEIDLASGAAHVLRHGMTGQVRMHGQPETLGTVLRRKLVAFTSQL